MIKDDKNYFCCKGCQGVYHLLKNDGLDSFYDKRKNFKISPPIKTDDDLARFDLNTFQKIYVKDTQDGYKQINLIIQGIHCSACVWLNEKVLYQTDGIIEANINFTNYKATIVWDNSKLKLSQIIQKIQAIGYDAYPYDKTTSNKKATKDKRDFFIKMMVAVFASINIMMLGVAKYSGFFTGIDKDILSLVHWGELVLTTPVLFYSGAIFFKGAYYGVKNRIINMDFLVISGASITYIYSLYVMFSGYGHSYFDSVTMIITFVLVGKYLEVLGKKSASDTLDTIKSQLPSETTVIKNNQKTILSPDEVQIGDIIELKAGEKASVDGVVISGQSTFDQSSLSGESIPIDKKIDDKIISGTLNLDGVILYKATKDYEHSTLNSIVNIIEDSLNSKSDIENKTNELSKYFSITILSIAILSFISWYFFSGDFEKSLIILISVIVIACPCALALATPIASLVGIGQLAKKRLLFKEAKYLQTLAQTDILVLDKTGTITKGNLKVKNQSLNLDKKQLNLLYSLVSSSNHLVSIAIKKYLQNNFTNLTLLNLQNTKQLPSFGMEATFDDVKIFGGKLQDGKDYANTVFHFTIDDKTISTFLLEDEVKKDAKEILQYFKKQNIKIVLATGDNQKVTKQIANEVGIDDFRANMTPQDKSNLIEKLKKDNKIVVMVGDGANDALALAKAHIGIVMKGGSDMSIAISDIVILDNSLSGLKNSIKISKKTYSLIKQNLTISLIYNIITIPLAIAGFVIPLVAALSMSLSSLLVVLNSLRAKNK
jgi:Cu+-exporting ATPase